MCSPTQITSPISTSRPVSSATSRTAASLTLSPRSTFPPGTAQSPFDGSWPRWTRRMRPSSSTRTTPTPTSGRSTVVIVVHDDGTGREASCLEEVLGQAVAGQDVCIEFRDPTFTEEIHHELTHLLTEGDLSRIRLDIDQSDRADVLPFGLGQDLLDLGRH